jgi:transcriptional regulator with XRE-family HTH domain
LLRDKLYEICETASAMAQLAPAVRSQCATRLKALRAQRGFDRARYFARSLGIEENRYTRYERAEVEPSLTLIHKMCETLQVTPNELLGFAEASAVPPGFTEGAQPEVAQQRDAQAASGRDAWQSLAWRLASQAVALRQEHPRKKGGAADPFEVMRETTKLHRRLHSEPFATVGEIVADPALKNADAKRKRALAELIRAYTESVAEAALTSR